MTNSQKPHKQIPKPMMPFNFGMTSLTGFNEFVVRLNLKMNKTSFGFHCFAEWLQFLAGKTVAIIVIWHLLCLVKLNKLCWERYLKEKKQGMLSVSGAKLM